MKSTIFEDILSDGSKVYNLRITDDSARQEFITDFHCVSLEAAEELQYKLVVLTVDFLG